MERRQEHDPKREEERREHGRSDRGEPGREQRPTEEQFPGQHGRGPQERMPGRSEDLQREPSRQGAPSGQRPPETPRKFGERRDKPTGERDRR